MAFFVCWHRLLSKTLDEAVKTSYSEGNRPVISDQETKTAQITSRSPDSQEIHRKSPVQCSDRSVQPPPVLSPSRTYIGASGLWESALIGNPYQSAVILYGFSCCCHFGGIEEESKPSQAKELPQFPQKCRGHHVHSRGENGVGVTVCTNDTWQPMAARWAV